MSERSGSSPPADLAIFYADQYPRVRGALVLFTGSPGVADELAQEGFVKACEHWEKVRTMESPGAWVHRVAINLAISRARKRSNELRTLERLRRERSADLLDGVEDRTVVAAALAELTHDDRAVVVLRYYADLSVAETAHVLAIPEGTVKTRTRRALGELRAAGLAIATEHEARDEDPDDEHEGVVAS